ncbi:MAG: cob(I)yrinic acid a,c-diamide adenosyltransferase [Sporolactobacillus sp.]
MKLYTKKGDQGVTQLVGGVKIGKDALQVRVYGSLDEVNAWTGYAVTSCTPRTEDLRMDLLEVQHCLFDVGHDLALPTGNSNFFLAEKTVSWLETRIDAYCARSPEIHQFILPGGSVLAARLHLARTVTRRAERELIAFQRQSPRPPTCLQFVNRLSDFFFAAARFANVCENKQDISYTSHRT